MEEPGQTLRYVTVILDLTSDTIEIQHPGMSKFEALGVLQAAAGDQEAFVLGDDDE